MKQEPDAAREAYFRLTGSDPEDALTRAIYDATVPCFTHDFSMSADYYRQLEGWMAERGLIDATPGAGFEEMIAAAAQTTMSNAYRPQIF